MSMQNVAIVGVDNSYFTLNLEYGISAKVEDVSSESVTLNLEDAFTVVLSRRDLGNLLSLTDIASHLNVNYKENLMFQGEYYSGMHVYFKSIAIGCILMLTDSAGRTLYQAHSYGEHRKSSYTGDTVLQCLEWFTALLAS